MNQKMKEALLQLIKISQYAGMREDIVQAGGGNTSIKIGKEQMLIKASGYQLTDIDLKSGYSLVDPRPIMVLFDSSSNEELSDDMAKRALSSALIEGKRPSIETFLHVTTDKLTLHTHPVVVNILMMRKNGMNILHELFPEALFVEYATPGIELAKKFFQKQCEHQMKKCSIVFLKNHGLIVTGKTSEEVIEKNEMILQRIEIYLNLDMRAYHNSTLLWDAFSMIGQTGIVWTVTDINILKTHQKFNGLWPHEITPDCLVYCGKKMLQIEDDEELEKKITQHIHRYGPITVILWKGALYIYTATVRKAMEIQSVLSFSAQVMLKNKQEAYDLLPEKEQDFLLHWDSEIYRQSLKN